MNVNIVLIVVAVVALFKVWDGYKKGMVKEIISLVTLLIVGIMIALLGCALHNYMKREIMGLVVVILLLAVLGVVHTLLGFVFFSIKMISKLPVVSFLNRLLGAVFGLLEVVVVLMVLFFFLENFGLGVIGAQIQEYISEIEPLQYIYDHNLVATLMDKIVEAIGTSL